VIIRGEIFRSSIQSIASKAAQEFSWRNEHPRSNKQPIRTVSDFKAVILLTGRVDDLSLLSSSMSMSRSSRLHAPRERAGRLARPCSQELTIPGSRAIVRIRASNKYRMYLYSLSVPAGQVPDGGQMQTRLQDDTWRIFMRD
jgi:hypothetical protein